MGLLDASMNKLSIFQKINGQVVRRNEEDYST